MVHRALSLILGYSYEERYHQIIIVYLFYQVILSDTKGFFLILGD